MVRLVPSLDRLDATGVNPVVLEVLGAALAPRFAAKGSSSTNPTGLSTLADVVPAESSQFPQVMPLTVPTPGRYKWALVP